MYAISEQTSINIRNSLSAFLFGAAVGAVAAILYAPASGEEMRSQIEDKANLLKDKAREWKDHAVDTSDKWAAAAKSQVSNALHIADIHLPLSIESLPNNAVDFDRVKKRRGARA